MAKSERRQKLLEAKEEKRKKKAIRAKYDIPSRYASKGGKVKYDCDLHPEDLALLKHMDE